MDATCGIVNDIQVPKLYYSYSNRFDDANCSCKAMEVSQFYIQSWCE